MVNKATVFYVCSGKVKVCFTENDESFINVYPDCNCENIIEYYFDNKDLLKFKQALDVILQEIDVEVDP